MQNFTLRHFLHRLSSSLITRVCSLINLMVMASIFLIVWPVCLSPLASWSLARFRPSRYRRCPSLALLIACSAHFLSLIRSPVLLNLDKLAAYRLSELRESIGVSRGGH